MFMQKLRNQALRKFRQTKLPNHYEYYKQLRNYTTSAIGSEEKKYLRTKFQNSSHKDEWRELRKLQLIKNKNKNLPANLNNLTNINDLLIQSLQGINNYPRLEIIKFYNNNVMQNLNNSIFTFKLSSEDEILKHLMS